MSLRGNNQCHDPDAIRNSSSHARGLAAHRPFAGRASCLGEALWRRPSPTGPTGGQRLYTDADLARLSLLARAIAGGRNIGQISELSASASWKGLITADETERANSARTVEGRQLRASCFLSLALNAVAELDMFELEEVLRRATMHLSTVVAIDEVIVPLLHEVGRKWECGEITPGPRTPWHGGGPPRPGLDVELGGGAGQRAGRGHRHTGRPAPRAGRQDRRHHHQLRELEGHLHRERPAGRVDRDGGAARRARGSSRSR